MFINDCLDFLRFAAETEGLLLRTRETVETETPLSLAISCIVIFFHSKCSPRKHFLTILSVAYLWVNNK